MQKVAMPDQDANKESIQQVADSVAEAADSDVLLLNGPMTRPLDVRVIDLCASRRRRSHVLSCSGHRGWRCGSGVSDRSLPAGPLRSFQSVRERLLQERWNAGSVGRSRAGHRRLRRARAAGRSDVERGRAGRDSFRIDRAVRIVDVADEGLRCLRALSVGDQEAEPGTHHDENCHSRRDRLGGSAVRADI